MESFGEYLKRERELRGVTIEEITNTTNISTRFIEAIENDMFDELPAEVFVKGFLKAYSKAIGLDPNEIILTYTEFINKKKGRNSVAREEEEEEREYLEHTIRKNNIRNIILVILGLTIITIILLLVFKNRKNDEVLLPSVIETSPQVQPSEGQKATNVITGNAPILDNNVNVDDVENKKEGAGNEDNQIVSSQPSKDIIEKTREEPVPVVEDKRLELTVIALEDLWLSVEIDGGIANEVLLHKDERVNWKAEDKFVLNIGNKKGTILRLNGQDIALPNDGYNVQRNFVLTRDNLIPQ